MRRYARGQYAADSPVQDPLRGSDAAGIRRIEAITGDEAIKYYSQREHELAVLRDIFKGNHDLEKAAVTMVAENAALRKEVEGFLRQKVARLKDELKRSMQPVGIVILSQAWWNSIRCLSRV